MIEPLHISFEVDCPVEHAFDTWTSRIDDWWPADHTVSNDSTSTILLEREVGGRLYERTTDGSEFDWGRITQWDPPTDFGYTWHLRRDAADATDVMISFRPTRNRRTRVDIVHSGWERLGEGGQDWRDRNRGGWNTLLPHFVAASERNHSWQQEPRTTRGSS